MKRRVIIIIVAFFLLFVIAELYIDANLIQITNFYISSEKIPGSFDGYKIVQLSDLHSKEFGKESEYLIRKIDEVSPNIIVFTGDMITVTEVDFRVFFKLIEQLSGKYEMYFVLGNHEYALEEIQKVEIKKKLSDVGIIYLDNNMIQLTENSEVINLYGLWYENKFYFKTKDYTLDESVIETLIGKKDPNIFDILLTHNPGYIELYSKWGADLIFSGHVHGGMVRLPFIGGLYSSDEGLFPTYSAGLYEVNGSKLIISRGLGRGSRGFRLFNRPELVVVTLKST